MSGIGFSQQDSSKKGQDSVKNQNLLDQSKQLQELENARKADSLKKAELEAQLNSLKTTDNVKKQELLDELSKIKNKDAERLLQKKQKIDSLRSITNGFPVIPFLNDTLFSIYNRSGSLSPQSRADAITGRIKNLTSDYFFKRDTLKISPAETTIDIVYGESIIMSVNENDALWQNSSREELAAKYKVIIENSVLHYKDATSWQTIIKEIGLALLVLAVLITFIYFTLKLFRFIRGKILLEKNKRIKGVKIRNYELFDANKQLNFILGVITVLKWLIIIIAVYLALPILFSIFPWTKGFAGTLIGYVTTPLKHIIKGIWNYLPNLFTILVIVIVFRYVIKGVKYLKTEVENGALHIKGFYPDWANPTFQIVKVLLYAFMFIVIFPYLPGSDSPVFQGVSVFLGVLFTFGSSGSLSNVIAGLVLTYMRAFKIGDRVNINDVTGDIIEKTLLVTRVRTIKNEIISIPNSNVMNNHTINYSSDSLERGLIMHTTVTIGYDVPWRTMHQALINSVERTELLLKEPKPFVLQTSLDDYYVSYQINAYTKSPNSQAVIYSNLHQNIQDCCNEMGIEILSPHYRAVRDGNVTTIPSDYLPKDYTAPAFKVENTDTKK